MSENNKIIISDLKKTIKGSLILSNINLEFIGGKVYGLKGKNGSGKTMLMRAISGLIVPTGGTIDINGEKLGKEISFPRSIGILIENPSFISSYTGIKNLEILAAIQKKIDNARIRETLEEVGLAPDDKRTYRKYSLGMKQRLGIAAAVMEYPDIILLDEPINALDESGAKLVRKILKKAKDRGAVIILACHDTEELEFLSDEIYIITDGEITEHVVLNKESSTNVNEL